MSSVSSNVPSFRIAVPPNQSHLNSSDFHLDKHKHKKHKIKSKYRNKPLNDDNWEPHNNCKSYGTKPLPDLTSLYSHPTRSVPTSYSYSDKYPSEPGLKRINSKAYTNQHPSHLYNTLDTEIVTDKQDDEYTHHNSNNFNFHQNNLYNLHKTSLPPSIHTPQYTVSKHTQNDPKRQQDIRRGLFAADELVDITARDYPNIDSQCILRFPPNIANIIHTRLFNKQEIGLTITSTSLYDYRLFEINIEGVEEELTGILVELPNIIESFKTLDGDLMFKSGDISQMMVVLSSQSNEEIDLNKLKEFDHWEWKSGLTPATHNIRTRKFQNFNFIEKHLLRNAEYEVIELLSGLSRDSYELLAHTENDMIENFDKFQIGETTERVITTSDDLQQFLDSGFASDASDNLFGLPHTPWAPAETVKPAGSARIGRPRRQPLATPAGLTAEEIEKPNSINLNSPAVINNQSFDHADLSKEMAKRERKRMKKERKKWEKKEAKMRNKHTPNINVLQLI